MKKVIFVRHAKSSWTDFSLSDFERPLNSRGHLDAPEIAERLKSIGYLPTKLISSDAKRALTTANYFGKCFELPIKIASNLYHGEPDNYLDVIQSEDDGIDVLALFGHNPGITYLANMISNNCTDNIPTCGVIIANYQGDSWENASWDKFSLVEIITPKDENID